MTICILHFPPEYPAWLRIILPKSLFFKLCSLSCAKRNPRDEAYMRNLAEKHISDPAFIKADELTLEHIRNASEIILLWPDAIGYGWRKPERKVFTNMAAGTQIRVLNGRRRSFELKRSTHRACKTKRIIERLWIGEAFFCAIFVICTPFLLFFDLVQGRR